MYICSSACQACEQMIKRFSCYQFYRKSILLNYKFCVNFPDITSKFSSVALQPFVGHWPLFQFRNPIHGRTSSMGDQPITRPLLPRRTAQTQNKSTQTSMPWVGFEPMTTVFKRAKTVHALDCVATVISSKFHSDIKFRIELYKFFIHCRYVYYLSSHQISYSLFQWFISYYCQTES
jgi:hypothetical protein